MLRFVRAHVGAVRPDSEESPIAVLAQFPTIGSGSAPADYLLRVVGEGGNSTFYTQPKPRTH